jgi:hypothetical protein
LTLASVNPPAPRQPVKWTRIVNRNEEWSSTADRPRRLFTKLPRPGNHANIHRAEAISIIITIAITREDSKLWTSFFAYRDPRICETKLNLRP